jgi:outer membrane protein assembly factor BamB
VHTPILYNDRMFAVGKRSRGLFTCLDFDGKIVWSSEGKATFGLGGFFLADGMFFILDGDSGTLRLVEANTTEYKELAQAKLLNGGDVWAPMGLSGGRLVLRDMTKMICIEVGSTK